MQNGTSLYDRSTFHVLFVSIFDSANFILKWSKNFVLDVMFLTFSSGTLLTNHFFSHDGLPCKILAYNLCLGLVFVDCQFSLLAIYLLG